MLLKYETTLNVYQYKDKTILCRIQPTTDANNREKQNTCRSMTTDQWCIFDKELRRWLDNNDCELDEQSCTFKVAPNLEAKIRKSKLSVKHFYSCVRNGDNCEELEEQKNLHVLDCRLEYKPSLSKLPPTPSIPIDEYEPIPTTGINNQSLSPMSYEPYTPSKRLRQHSAVDKIKTPGIDFLGFDSTEDTYSPKPIPPTVDTDDDDAISAYGTQPTIPKYKPAPITDKSSSPDSHQSNVNEVIPETDDEQLAPAVHRSKRTRLKAKCKKHCDYGEYIPDSQDFTDDVPAYNPTPIIEDIKPEQDFTEDVPAYNPTPIIEDIKPEQDFTDDVPAYNPTPIIEGIKPEQLKVPQEFETRHEIVEVSKRHKEKKKTETCDDDKKYKKEKSKETVKNKETSLSSNMAASSSDEFENGSSKKRKDRNNKKKESVHEVDSGSSKHRYKERKESVHEADSGSSKHRDKERKERVHETDNSPSKDIRKGNKNGQWKEKRISKETMDEKETKRIDIKKLISREKSRHQSSPTRRSARSPSKPRRYIEEQVKYEAKKSKSLKTSPTNKELFGTDDDDEGNKKHSDSNNNASTNLSVFNTPKPDKKNTSLVLSSSSSSSSKKKRKRNDCEQEKADLSKWLGKKKSDSEHDKTPESSKGKSALPGKEKSSKKMKSSKENKPTRNKSASPQPMDIVMPSKEELELLRSKNKLQREENEKFKSVLEKIHVPPPKEVAHLSLKDMTLNDLLDTFTTYKDDLDQIYKKNRKKDHVRGSDGINHCLVIGLTDQRIQLKMMEKLSDVYNNTNSTTQATLYANALLPEWIIRVFMEKHKLNRLEAISQIESQEAYKSYVEGQNENSLLFDDE